MIRVRPSVIALGAALILSGCATFPGKVLPQVSGFPSVSEKPSVSVNLTFRQYMNGQPINFGVKAGESRLQDKILERFRRSGLFSSVSVVDSNADISVLVDMKDEGSGSMGMAVLTGLSLYIIPSSATDLYKVSVKVRNKKSGLEKTLETEDFVTTWQQIFLLPLLPFKLAPVEADRVLNNIMDTVAIKVHEAATCGVEKALVATGETAVEEVRAPASCANADDVSKRLLLLKNAYEAGLITQAEYTQKKTQLETAKAAVPDVLKKLNLLKEAYAAGLITQSEYEQKKAELVKGI